MVPKWDHAAHAAHLVRGKEENPGQSDQLASNPWIVSMIAPELHISECVALNGITVPLVAEDDQNGTVPSPSNFFATLPGRSKVIAPTLGPRVAYPLPAMLAQRTPGGRPGAVAHRARAFARWVGEIGTPARCQRKAL